MIGEKAQKTWRQFKESSPGSRFQDRYHRRQHSGEGRLVSARTINLVAGIVLTLVGLASMPFPIPADGSLVPLGLVLIAGEIEPVARFIDWFEVRARKMVGWAVSFWSKSSTAMRFLSVVAYSPMGAHRPDDGSTRWGGLHRLRDVHIRV